jgi:hypothetical protein
MIGLSLCSLVCLGCSSDDPPKDVTRLTNIDLDELQKKLDDELEYTFSRRLDLQKQATWQILHGALAFQREFQVITADGETVSAVDYLLAGGVMNGWDIRLVPSKTRPNPGIRALLDPGSKAGQGHRDQWFAVLAQCDLLPEQTIKVYGETVTMADFVFQVQQDVPRNLEREYSWTLIGLTKYLPTSATWTGSDGKQWSIERLMEIELEQDLNRSACGGTHRLIGITMALLQHLADGGQLTGVWKQADDKIQASIARAKELQNPDGSFSINYFQREGISADLAQDLGSTGHVLEFLTLAMTQEQLSEPWVQHSVSHMCELFHRTRGIGLECGALYHAAHGLVLYRQRVFGARSWKP